MPAISILSLALGLAFLSGINLYLTTFLAGLAGRMGWLHAIGAPDVLGFVSHPAVMTIAFLLFLLEAFVDKVPWVDSLWDALHTVIRPAGAVLLALDVMGTADPSYKVMAGILAGIAGLTTHLTKAGLRLLINTTPEPLSNILTSIAEDVLVAGLFALLLYHPLAGLITCLSLVVLLWLLLPKLFRLMKANLYLMWKKLRLPGNTDETQLILPSRISAEQDMLLHSQLSGPLTISWAVPCVTGKIRRFPNLVPNAFGTLVSTKEHPGTLVFLSRRWFQQAPARLSLPGCDILHESSFLSESLVIYNKSEKRQASFRFTRGHQTLAAFLESDLRQRLKSGIPSEPLTLTTPSAETTPENTPLPAPEPTPVPVLVSTPEPTPEPTPVPVAEPTPEPSPAPVPEPTPEPSPEPNPEPTPETTPLSALEPTPEPALEPAPEPAPEPTLVPIPEPALTPAPQPTPAPSPDPFPSPSHDSPTFFHELPTPPTPPSPPSPDPIPAFPDPSPPPQQTS